MPQDQVDVSNQSIQAFGFSDAILMKLRGIGIKTVGDLMVKTPSELCKELRAMCAQKDAQKVALEIERELLHCGVCMSQKIAAPVDDEYGLSDEQIAQLEKIALYKSRQLLKTIFDPAIEDKDVVQECLMQMKKIVRRFDPLRGTAFITYAEHRIHGQILDMARHWACLPRSVTDTLKKMKKAHVELLKETGKEPTLPEIAHRSKISVKILSSALRRNETPRIFISLDEINETENGNGSSMLEFVRDAPSQIETMVDEEFEKTVALALVSSRLNSNELQAIKLYFGFCSSPPRGLTMKETGQRMGLTRSRISQIVSSALKKLRNKKVYSVMYEYMPSLLPPE